MSDFPIGGDVHTTRAWLDSKGFVGILDGWEADSLLGLLEPNVREILPGMEGLKLWGYINRARHLQDNRQQGNLSFPIPTFPAIYLSI